MMKERSPSDHFKGKDALGHILEKRSIPEPHGSEMPDHLAAANDAARLMALFLILIYTIAYFLNLPSQQTWILLGLFSLGGLIAFIGRRAWIGWAHLERLHRLLEQERYEIEHHRPQERDELRALYQLKGFEDPLLDQVVDVLMADDNRLLKVMLEEEMGLSLGAYEHPLKQALGAAIGSLIAIIISFLALLILPTYGMIAVSLTLIGISGGVSAYLEGNRIVSAVIWNLAIAMLSLGSVFFLLKFIVS